MARKKLKVEMKIAQGKATRDQPIIRQDGMKKYKVTDEMKKKGSLKGKTAIHIPALKMTIYTSYQERADELIEKYTNRHLKIEGTIPMPAYKPQIDVLEAV